MENVAWLDVIYTLITFFMMIGIVVGIILIIRKFVEHVNRNKRIEQKLDELLKKKDERL